jgi:hypothetical protein
MFFSFERLITKEFLKVLFNFEVKAFIEEKDICSEDGTMWEKKSSGVFVKKTEKAVRKIADRKTNMIEQTAEWMKKYQYAQWPANHDKVEQEIKDKITTALSEDMKHTPAFTAWVLYQTAAKLIEDLEVKAIWE